MRELTTAPADLELTMHHQTTAPETTAPERELTLADLTAIMNLARRSRDPRLPPHGALDALAGQLTVHHECGVPSDTEVVVLTKESALRMAVMASVRHDDANGMLG